MSIFDGYTEVTGAARIEEGQRVRLMLSFVSLPLSFPSRADWEAAAGRQVDITLDRVDAGDTGVYLWGLADAVMTAAEFQAQLGNLAQDVNQNSIVGVRVVGSPRVEVLDAAAPQGGGMGLPGLGLGLGFGAVLAIALVAFILVKGRV